MPVDLSSYPPAPVLAVSKALDIVCNPLQCQEWRNYVPFWNEWFSYRVGSVIEVFPPTLSYHDFLDGRESTFSELCTYAFQTPSTALGNLTTPTSAMTLFGLVVLIRILKSILLPFFSNLGRKAGRHTHGPDWEAHNEIRIVKFGEYVFRLLYHFLISVAGIYYFWDKPWWNQGGTRLLFLDYPYHEIAPGMTWYYLVQSAYNLEALWSLMELSVVIRFYNPQKKFPIQLEWSPTVRGDFREMAVHHVVTNLLVIGSSFFRFTRIGSMVFLVHDISDVPVDLSKLANFLKWKVCTIVCFVTMCLLWLVFRLGVLPFVIYKSVLTESMLLLESGEIDPVLYFCYRYFFYYLVGQIILLHVAWFIMFIRMGYILAFKGEAHDLSEHKKGEKYPEGIKTNGTTNDTKNGTTNGKKKH